MGVDLAQDHMFSGTLTQGDLAKNLQPIPTAQKLWASSQKMPPPEDVHLCQCELGKLRWLATASRLDICAHSARAASCINSLQGSDRYRIEDLSRTAKTCQKAPVLKYASSSQLGAACSSPERS